MEGGQPKVIANAEGGRTTPRVVGFTQGGERLVGALGQAPGRGQPQEHRLLHQALHGPAAQRGGATRSKLVPYKVVRAARTAGSRWRSRGKHYTPEEISRHGPAEAEGQTPRPTWARRSPRRSSPCPPTSTTPSARPPRTPARSPGLEVLRIINEPTAAALAYGLDKKENENIARLRPRRRHLRRLHPGGRRRRLRGPVHQRRHPPGRRRLRPRIMDFLADEFKRDQGIDLRRDPQALQRLKEAAEKAKMRALPAPGDRGQPALHHRRCHRAPSTWTSRSPAPSSSSSTADLWSAAASPVKDALADAHMSVKEIDEVVLVGGSTRMPAVQGLVKELFGKEPQQERQPGRGGGHRRRHPGRRAQGRGQGRAAPRRHPAVARASRPRAA